MQSHLSTIYTCSVVVDGIVRYVAQYNDGSLASVVDLLVDCIISSINEIDDMIMKLLSSLTQETVHKVHCVCVYVCLIHVYYALLHVCEWFR